MRTERCPWQRKPMWPDLILPFPVATSGSCCQAPNGVWFQPPPPQPHVTLLSRSLYAADVIGAAFFRANNPLLVCPCQVQAVARAAPLAYLDSEGGGGGGALAINWRVAVPISMVSCEHDSANGAELGGTGYAGVGYRAWAWVGKWRTREELDAPMEGLYASARRGAAVETWGER